MAYQEPPAHTLETRRQLLGLLLRHTPGNLLAYLGIGLLSTAYIWSQTRDPGVIAWMLALASMVAMRAAWLWRIKPRLAGCGPVALSRAETQAVWLVGLSGLTWGSLVWVVFDGSRTHVDLFATATLVGMVGGAVTPLSTMRWAFPVYVVAILSPYVIKSMLIGGGLYLSGSVAIIGYALILLAYGRVTHRALWQAYSLQLEKDGLLAEQAALSRSRSLFLAGVSHDLRQPVQALGLFNGYLRSLAGEQHGPLHAELLRLADNNSLALAAINGQISRLLELSRLEAGEIKPHHRAVRLADLFEYTRIQQFDKASAKGIELRFVATRLVGISDLKMLQSILDNLVSNAVRYTARGKVLVGARRRGAQIEIQVLDTGPGLPEDRIPMLFEPYRRFDDTAQGADVGHGLGLALVNRQVTLLGHELLVNSQPGQGTRFGVLLPRMSGNAAVL